MTSFTRLSVLVVSILISTISFGSEAEDRTRPNVLPPIKVAYIEFPPVFSTNERGEAEGLLIDLAKLVLPKTGYAWTTISLPTKRMADSIANGYVDLWIGLSTLPEFKDKTYIGKHTVATIELNAYGLNDVPVIVKKEDLVGKRIITMHGFSYGGWINFILDPKNNIYECRAFTHEQAVLMLKHKRCEYLLNYTGPMKSVLKTHSVPHLKHQRISALQAKFVVSKKRPDSKQFFDALEKSYLEVVSEGLWPR